MFHLMKMSTCQVRRVYTREQRSILEASFARQSHPDLNEKERLAKLLNCNLIQICNWFQNHRRRVRKQQQQMSTQAHSTMACQTFNYQNECSSYGLYQQSPSQYVGSLYVYPQETWENAMTYDPFVNYYT
ncbi:unnamed protein product [Adineta ricciae]|uniref:Homeobox domain-containing protein n=1 Tax=Adineta ricciae TaxID=249248 RepID=A0A814ERC2_ADIRI|nr:unnamed protein product [Adineta ricciae]CAF1652839.1 unnamed protein product [Adineta ricciae]